MEVCFLFFLKEPAIWNPDVKKGDSNLLSAWGPVLRTFPFFHHLIGLPLPEIIIHIYRRVKLPRIWKI